jgi:SNF2 family DNA or RNA helicase
VIIDESSLFKNPSTTRFKSLYSRVPYIQRILLMTGTPIPNGFLDLFSQIKLVDGGQRLGRSLHAFTTTYFNRNPFFQFAKPTLRPEAAPIITSKIATCSTSLRQADYLDLEPIQYNRVSIDPSPTLRKHYKSMKETLITQINGGSSTLLLSASLQHLTTISAQSAAAAANKLLQFCGGFAYDQDLTSHLLDDAKLQTLDELLLTAEADNKNVLLFYTYAQERDAILKRYPSSMSISDNDAIRKWNSNQVPLLVLHPASGGHGLNLQDGGHTVVWYNMTYNLEHWLQGNKRVHRMGQTRPVTVYSLTYRDFLDDYIYSQVLTQKGSTQQALVDALSSPTDRAFTK